MEGSASATPAEEAAAVGIRPCLSSIRVRCRAVVYRCSMHAGPVGGGNESDVHKAATTMSDYDSEHQVGRLDDELELFSISKPEL